MLLSNLIKYNRTLRNEKYNQKLRKEILFTNTPSIIANNCIGGVIYHNLNMAFKSPTINLYFRNEDFLLFVSHLETFMAAQLLECSEQKKEFPVGKLVCEHGEVQIYFQHYKSFAHAKEKWEQRAKRIDWNNIVIIMEEGIETSDEVVRQFQTLPYDRKVLVCNGNAGHVAVENGYPMYIYDKKYHPGKILDFGRFKISSKRYLDDWDYVRFLNTGEIRKK